MSIYYLNGCLSLFDVSDLTRMPKRAAKKIVKLLWKNRYNVDNEQSLELLKAWLRDKIEFYTKAAMDSDNAAKELKFYTSLKEVIS